MKLRLVALEKKSAEEGIILTEAHVQALEVILAALKLQHNINIAPGITPAHSPYYIIMPLLQIRRYMGSGTFLQCFKVKVFYKSFRHKIQKAFHHYRIAEKCLICRVMREFIFWHGLQYQLTFR